MLKTIDARGLACPMPVVETKKALAEFGEGTLEVLVDNEVSRDNVIKFASSSGYLVDSQKKLSGYAVNINKQVEMPLNGMDRIFAQQSDTPLAFLIKDQYFGVGDEELGRILMRSFLFTLLESDEPIKTIIFMNAGVYLALNDSEVLDTLRGIEEKGTEILSCGTCLDFYQVKDQLAVGIITNMYTAVEQLIRQGVRTVTI